MEHKRFKSWKPNAEIMKKIDEALKNPAIKARVEKAKERDQRFQTSSSSATPTPTTLAPEPSSEPRGFAIAWHKAGDAKSTPSSYSAMERSSYDIINSWILDSGSNIHICNNSNRFRPTQSTTSEDYLVSGSTTYQIEAYGDVDITLTSPTGDKKKKTLYHVALVPSFFTNLVSYSKAMKAGIYWDGKRDKLFTEADGRQTDFCSLIPHNGHWIMEYNSPTSSSASCSASATSNSSNISPQSGQKDVRQDLQMDLGRANPNANQISLISTSSTATTQHTTKKLTPTQLHHIMAHAGPQAIARLPSTANGIKLTKPCTPDEFRSCEACRVSKAHSIISRSSDHEIPSDKPLHQICFDLIPMTSAFNSHQWVSHFICDEYGFHWV